VAVAAAALLCVLGWVIGTRLGEIRAVVADVAQETVGEPAAESSSAAVNGSSERPTPRASTSSTAKAGSRPGAASTFALPGGDPGVVATATEPLDTELDTPPAVVDGDLDAPEIDVDDVYTKGDPDVIPPQSVYPKLPSERAGRTAPGRTVLELLISAEGFVEHVRLRTPPRDVHEFMLVSAAKAWRFDPATVNGRPVRFLHTVSITRLE
jgi:hypothetical protein